MSIKKPSSTWNTGGDNGNSDDRTDVSMENSYGGLRLRNDSRVECYLNTAINTVVTNEILMEEVIREDPLKQWGMDILLMHDPNYDPNRETTHTVFYQLLLISAHTLRGVVILMESCVLHLLKIR